MLHYRVTEYLTLLYRAYYHTDLLLDLSYQRPLLAEMAYGVRGDFHTLTPCKNENSSLRCG